MSNSLDHLRRIVATALPINLITNNFLNYNASLAIGVVVPISTFGTLVSLIVSSITKGLSCLKKTVNRFAKRNASKTDNEKEDLKDEKPVIGFRDNEKTT